MVDRYRIEFERNNGFRFFQNDRSLVLGLIATYKEVLSDTMRSAGTSAAETLLHSIKVVRDAAPMLASPPLPVMRAANFTTPPDQPLFKYVSADTWKYLSAGSIQLGSAHYYREIENPNARDWQEGLSTVHFHDESKEASIQLTSGFDWAIFCGTSQPDTTRHRQMMNKFGGAGGYCLKIEPVPEFIQFLKRNTRAIRARVHDVVYCDTKVFACEYPQLPKLREALGEGDQTLARLRRLNIDFFSVFAQAALLPSLFSKPLGFSGECERRIALQFKRDLATSTIHFRDRSALDFIKVVDRAS